MSLGNRFQKSESGREFPEQGFRRIPLNIQSAAFLRTVERECGDYDKTTRTQGESDLPGVGATIFRIGEKMEDGTIMPEAIPAFAQ